MKVLITGVGSYIGTNVERVLKDANMQVDSINMIGDEWKNYDFSPYDCVFHVAGIAHDIGGDKRKDEYLNVNFRLAVECCKKAKTEGVKQFVFMSSVLIYNGLKINMITKDTEPKTKSVYAESKLLADCSVRAMATENFTVAVMRPPMIFGPNCKGNFPRLVNLARKLKIFPNYKNQRSMCFIDNFCYAVKYVIENKKGGIFFPQNKEYFSTTDIVKASAEKKGKKIRFTKLFNFLIKPACKISSSVNKMFSDYVISKDLSSEFDEVITVNNQESLQKSVF